MLIIFRDYITEIQQKICIIKIINHVLTKGIDIMSVITITAENFENEVMNSQTPVLVDFWASWCGPCRMVSPIIEEIADEVTDKKICKVNVDEQPELAEKFGVMSIPTLIVFKNGKVVNQVVGARPKDDILEMLNS